MLDAFDLKKVALELKLFVIEVAECKQSSILISIQNNSTDFQKKSNIAKDG
jgi:hypothetical protein